MRHKGFTLIELLVVIAIIGILSTLAIVALGGARQKARDSKRVGDISQLSKAFELYYSDNAAYPTVVTPGQPLVSLDGTKTYLATIPSNPSPRADNGCANQDYMYAPRSDGQGYTIYYCLGSAAGGANAGMNIASETGLTSDGSLVLRLDAGVPASYPGTGTTWTDLSGKGNNGTLANMTSPTITGYDPTNGGSMVFDGTDDWVQLGTLFSGTTDFTILAWAKTSTGGIQALIGNYPPNTNGSLEFIWSTAANRAPYLYIHPSPILQKSVSNTGLIKQVVVTRTGGSLITFYVDGVALVGTANSNASILASAYRIGANTGNSELFTGNIYQMMVYTRGLSAGEILANYNSQKARYGL